MNIQCQITKKILDLGLSEWYPIATVEEINKIKKKAFRFFGKEYVLFINKEGRPVTIVDRCLHKGAKLSLGELIDGELICPYHSIRYFDKNQVVLPGGKRIKLKKAHCENLNSKIYKGFIWILNTKKKPLKFLLNNEYKMHYFFQSKVNCSVVSVIENLFDIGHFGPVHGNTFSKSKESEKLLVSYNKTEDGFIQKYKLEVEFNPDIDSLFKNKKVSYAEVINKFYSPLLHEFNVKYNSGLKYQSFQFIAPITEEETLLTQIGYGPSNLNSKKFKEMDQKIWEEDKIVLESLDESKNGYLSLAYFDEHSKKIIQSLEKYIQKLNN